MGMKNGVAAVENCVAVPQLSIELPYDPATLFLGICSKELKAGTPTDTCTPVFVAALVIIPKRFRNNPSVHQKMNG